jgi:hypothetical protein
MSYLLLSLKWRNDKILSKRFQAIIFVNIGVSETVSGPIEFEGRFICYPSYKHQPPKLPQFW